MTEDIKELASILGLTNTKNTYDEILHEAENNQITYRQFLTTLLQKEYGYKLDKAKKSKNQGRWISISEIS